MPEQDKIMTRMIAENPYSRSGHSAIGPKEGLLFSDIRLHLGLVLRSKNTHVFRPDIFRSTLEPSPAILSALSASHSMIKVRYISEEPLGNDRHLQFLPHMASAVTDLGGALAIYDVTAERMFTPEELHKELSANLEVNNFDFHVNVVWEKDLRAGHAETKGLVKKGMHELCTEDAHLDQRVLVQEVTMEAARTLWERNELPPQVEVIAFGDQFRLEIIKTRSGPYKARIFRVGAA